MSISTTSTTSTTSNKLFDKMKVVRQDIATKKFCRGCGEYHAATKEVFGADSRAADGLKNPCKHARSAKRKASTSTNSTKLDLSNSTTDNNFDNDNTKRDFVATTSTTISTKSPLSNLSKWLSKFGVMSVFVVAFFLRVNNGAAGLGGNSVLYVGDWLAWLASASIIAGVIVSFVFFRKRKTAVSLLLWLLLEALALGVDGVGVVQQINENKISNFENSRKEQIESINREHSEQARIAARFDTRNDKGDMIRLRDEAANTFYSATNRMIELSKNRTKIMAMEFDYTYNRIDWIMVVVWLFGPVLVMLSAIWFNVEYNK